WVSAGDTKLHSAERLPQHTIVGLAPCIRQRRDDLARREVAPVGPGRKEGGRWRDYAGLRPHAYRRIGKERGKDQRTSARARQYPTLRRRQPDRGDHGEQQEQVNGET